MCGIWVADHMVIWAAGGVDHHRAGFHERRNEALLPEGALHEHFGVADGLFDVAARAGLRGVEGPDGADVGTEIGVHQVRAVGGRGREIEHHRQVVVVDVDLLERVLRFVGAAGHHDGDGFAGEVHRVHRERGCGRRLHVFGDLPCAWQAALLGGEVGAGEDRDDAGHAARGAGVDTGDAGVRDGTAQDRQMLHPGQHDVVGPPGAAGDQMLVFLTQPGPADFGFGGGGHRTPPAVSAFAASLITASPDDGGAAAQPLRRILHRADDVLVSGAAAQVAFQAVPHRLVVRIGFLGEQVERLHDHAGRAEAALQRMVVAERFLDGVQLPVPGQAFDGEDVAAVGLHGEHRAGLDAVAVQVNGARAAVAGVAADHGADLAEPVTQVVHEEQPRLHLVRISRSIDGDSDAHRASNAGSVN